MLRSQISILRIVLKGTALLSNPTTFTGRRTGNAERPTLSSPLSQRSRTMDCCLETTLGLFFCLHVLSPPTEVHKLLQQECVLLSWTPHPMEHFLIPLNKACSPFSQMHSRTLLLINGFTWASPEAPHSTRMTHPEKFSNSSRKHSWRHLFDLLRWSNNWKGYSLGVESMQNPLCSKPHLAPTMCLASTALAFRTPPKKPLYLNCILWNSGDV